MTMRAHLVQFDIRWEDKPANHARVEALLADAPVRPGDLVLLPEMFDTGFSLNVERTHDGDGVSARFLSSLARKLTATVVGGVTVRRGDGMGLNRALTFSAGGEQVCQYDKMHPFSFGRESERFAAGDSLSLLEWSGTPALDPGRAIRVCPVVCYDLRFPELFRAALGLGAEAFAVIANWPRARQAHWRTLLLARAIENQAIALGVNRTGSDPHLEYVGGSIAVGPKGEILGELGAEEGVLSLELGEELVRAWREEFPAWRDVRRDLGPRIDAAAASERK